jgi:glycosyltransferase involved in cell wall biosynthesis
MYKNNKISIILPTLNEEKNLRLLIPQIVNLLEKELKISYEMIIVDDSSTDGTKDLVNKISRTNESVKFLPRSEPKSLPLSILDGVNFANSDDVMWLDADGSMTPLAVGKLLRTYFDYKNTLNEKVIIGSRFIEGGGYKGVKDVKNQSIISSIKNVRESNDSVFGMLLSIIINKLLSFLFNTELTDLTSGFIVLNKELISPQVFEGKEYGEYFIYLISSLLEKRAQIEEVGYICETRLHGYSKTGSGIIKFILRGIPYIKAAFYKGKK